MVLVFGTLLQRGDEVITVDPGYACYPTSIQFVESIPVTVPVYGEGYLRFSYANLIDNIAAGLDRIENCLENL